MAKKKEENEDLSSIHYNWYADNNGDPFKLDTTALAKRWKMKSGNCVLFAWCFYIMCQEQE